MNRKTDNGNNFSMWLLGIIGVGGIIGLVQMDGFIIMIIMAVIVILIGGLLYYAYKNIVKYYKKRHVKRNDYHYPTENNYTDLRQKYPIGVAQYQRLHPNCSWENVWKDRAIIELLESYNDYVSLLRKFPHGVAAFENTYPTYSYLDMLRRIKEIQELEEKYKKDEEKRIEEEEKEKERQKNLEQERQRNYEDMKTNFPHGLAEFQQLHPYHSLHNIWEHRTDIWRLEHDYKLKKHDELRDKFPHGYESFMKKNPRATIQDIIKNEDYLQTLEEEYAKDELTRKFNKSFERLELIQEWSNKIEETVKRFKENDFHRWELLNDRFLYSWIFYYYPTTVDFVKPYSVEDENRKIVWNFKNDPDRNVGHYRHQRAVDKVLRILYKILILMFGRGELKKMTFVCVPASTQIKNKARYESFSKALCDKSGMENGYEHVHFVKDGMSKNDPNNSTGCSIRPEVTFDDWFENRLVVLFDDVVTKGETMLYYKKMLQKAGAIVVGGLCIGKTKHEKPVTLPPLIVDDEDENDLTGA